jgi:tricorn protease
MGRHTTPVLAAVLLAALAVPAALEGAARGALPRYPTVSATTIVFTAAGDLWSVARAGGRARRLTDQPGLERCARFSPDDRWIAFTGQSAGDDDVYVVPAGGGEPTRLTWHPDIAPGAPRLGPDDMVVGWTPDGREVVFRSRRESVARVYSRLYAVALDGSLPRPLAALDTGLADLAPDGRRLAVARPFLEARTWKRYTGGLQSDLWLVDLGSGDTRRLTDHPGFDSAPMWGSDGVLYFISDRPERGGSFSRRNLFRLDVESGAVRQLTHHADFDVLWPSSGAGAIVYQLGGALRLFDVASGADREVPVEVPEAELRLASRSQPLADFVEEVTASPDGSQVLLVARGDLFTAPATGGPWRNLTRSQGVRERSAAWSPDGRSIACVSDAGGEDAIVVLPADGPPAARPLTGPLPGRPEGLVWSPDSEALAWVDATRTLWWLSLDGRKPEVVDRNVRGAPRDPVFSPDGRLLAWAKPDANGLSEIWAWPVGGERRVRLSPPWADAGRPAFDRGGEYVYWVSRTNLQPSRDAFEERWIFQDTDVIVGAALRASKPSPVAVTEAEAARTPTGEIDLDGVAARAVRLPLPAGRFPQLAGGDGAVFYLGVDPAQRDGRRPVAKYTLTSRAIETVLESTGTFALTADGRKLVWRDGEQLGICAAGPNQDKEQSRLQIDTLTAAIDPRAEWRQELREAWRHLRDRFYDPAMHGVDWEAVWRRHSALLPQLADRDDLDFLIGEMIGELNVSHAYVEPPGSDRPERVSVGLLGCDLEIDRGRYRFARVLSGEPGNPERRAPLAESGVHDGEYLLAVGGQELLPPANPFKPFAGATLREVRLRVGPDPSGAGSREVTVEPVASDLALRTWAWVTANRTRIAEATDGRVGYLHVPDTNQAGWAEFVRALRAQRHCDGLIVDLRYNAGGHIPDMFVELLTRRTLNFWAPRHGPLTRTPELVASPAQVFLINGYTSSGGDAFAFYARQLGLGPLIGTRTWGGLVGIENRLQLVGGGAVTVPGWAFVNLAGQWDIERIGVAPDIEVDALPAAGDGAQLERAIAEINHLLATAPPPPTPGAPPYPVRR